MTSFRLAQATQPDLFLSIWEDIRAPCDLTDSSTPMDLLALWSRVKLAEGPLME